MTNTTKPPKEKIGSTGPRITPRPTAASAARAARNATNRILAAPNSPRQSPIRCPPSPSVSKRPAIKSSRSDLKVNRNCDLEDISQHNSFYKKGNNEFDNSPVVLPDQVEDRTQCGVVNETLVFEEIVTDNITIITESQSSYDNELSTKDFSENEEIRKSPLPNSDKLQTPVTSRPQTPKSQSLSRPQTPKMPSRPTTPAQLSQGTTSRPNTPQRQSTPKRPQTPSRPAPEPSSRPTTPKHSQNYPPAPMLKDYEDLKKIYVTKQQQFHRMKKELDLKQQAILEVFNGLRSIRERMVSEGVAAGGEGPQELVVFNIADWAAEEVAQLCRDALESSMTDGVADFFNTVGPIDECALSEVELRTQNVPTYFANLCLQAFTARQELIDWIKDLADKNEVSSTDVLERISRYNSHGLELCETLREVKSRADTVVDTITSLTKRVCQERSTLIGVGESLVREVARLKQELESQAQILREVRENRTDIELKKMLEETRRELEEERAAKAAIKDKLSTAESQLRQTRTRISKMDKQLREAEASITSLTGTVKTLEEQNRQREVQLEARARKLKESLKTGELASSQIAQQRDALQKEVSDLKEQIQSLTNKYKSENHELSNQVNTLKIALDEEHKNVQRERTAKEELEALLSARQKNIEELDAKIKELENNRPNPDLPTEREMDLWAELHATKDVLRNTEEEVALCKREKIRFLETFTKIAESENKMGMQQKLAAELLNKEETISKMQNQIRDLTKNIKLNEQKVSQYEQYVRDLHAHKRAVANCQEAPNGISYQDLQQEIMDLKMNLLDAVHRNEELSELLAQKEQQLEQQDKTSRAQARVIKVREELINMLKNKETEQSQELTALQQDLERRMKIVDEVNKQIAAKADEIQELFTTLENKQQQIHRLEKIVLALEEQQRRAQAQRTRHEEKIAALEHELAAGINRKERKFLFF